MLLKVYRCWTVYGQSWRIMWLPIMFWLGSLTCTFLTTYYDHCGFTEEIERFLSIFDGATIGFYSSNIATNLFSTGTASLFCFVIWQVAIGAIIYRIIRVANASGNHPKRLHNTARILGESGTLYTLTTVFVLIASAFIIHFYGRGLTSIWDMSVALGVLDAVVCHPQSFLATLGPWPNFV